MREIDGMKIAFVTSEVYFDGLHTPSMYSTSRETGAHVVFLLAPGKTEADVSDEAIRDMLTLAANSREPANA